MARIDGLTDAQRKRVNTYMREPLRDAAGELANVKLALADGYAESKIAAFHQYFGIEDAEL